MVNFTKKINNIMTLKEFKDNADNIIKEVNIFLSNIRIIYNSNVTDDYLENIECKYELEPIDELNVFSSKYTIRVTIIFNDIRSNISICRELNINDNNVIRELESSLNAAIYIEGIKSIREKAKKDYES